MWRLWGLSEPEVSPEEDPKDPSFPQPGTEQSVAASLQCFPLAEGRGPVPCTENHPPANLQCSADDASIRQTSKPWTSSLDSKVEAVKPSLVSSTSVALALLSATLTVSWIVLLSSDRHALAAIGPLISEREELRPMEGSHLALASGDSAASHGPGNPPSASAYPKRLISLLRTEQRSLLEECQEKTQKLNASQIPKVSPQDMANSKRWAIPPLAPSFFHKGFGWAVSLGAAVESGRVNEEACFWLRVASEDGGMFDQGCFQRASFSGNLTLALEGTAVLGIQVTGLPLIRIGADITYVPSLSLHKVCYTAPTPGQYTLQLSLMFTNTFFVQTALNPVNFKGYAGYTTVVQTSINITSEGEFSLSAYRKQNLPVCSFQTIVQSRNRGFWVGNLWLPAACRLRRLGPRTLLLALLKLRVLFLGDSEMRYLYGVLQNYMTFKRRQQFLRAAGNRPFWKGSVIEASRLSNSRQPFDSSKGGVMHLEFNLSTGTAHFYGSKYTGFAQQILQGSPDKNPQRRGESAPLDSGSLTYVSYFGASRHDLFQEWMLNGTAPSRPWDEERPFDIVVEGSILHGVLSHNSARDYRDALASNFMPGLQRICPRKGCIFASWGPWTGVEEWKYPGVVYKSNNVRNSALEEEGYRFFEEHGRPSFLHMSAITVPVRGSELAVDPAHYSASVSLAMLDVLFGSLLAPCGGELI